MSFVFFICTVHTTSTTITFHMYESMHATHLNNTYTHIHITAQAIDRMIKPLREHIALFKVIHIGQQLYNRHTPHVLLISYLNMDMCLACISLIELNDLQQRIKTGCVARCVSIYSLA